MARKSEKGNRVAATLIIWAFATGMLAICIPLVENTGSGTILPLAVILGATISTVGVWRSSDNQSRSPLLANSIKELQQRMSNLEIIYSSQELDLQSRIKQLESRD